MDYTDFESMWKRYFKSALLSLDLILGFAAVIFSYQWYLARSADTVSSLVIILTCLGYFIFYPYYVIKLLDKDKMRAMAAIYADMLISKMDSEDEDDENVEIKKDDNSR